MNHMNLEFIEDLIGACRADPERFKDLLAAGALADILQMMVRRIVQLENEVSQASNYALAQHAQAPFYGAGTPAQPGQFVDIPTGASPQQWQQALMQQFQAAQQDRAALMERQATQFYLPPTNKA